MKHLLLLVVWITLVAAIQQAPSSECSALTQFYKRFNGDNWDRKAGWNNNMLNCCGWIGVGCEAGHVIELQLSNNHLTGHADSGSLDMLRQLPMLKSFVANHNDLRGQLPEFRHRSLMDLHLDNNKIEGELPHDFLRGLPNLKALSLEKNKLHGIVPPGYLKTLHSLRLGNNSMTGNLPSDFGPELRELDLHGNKLDGQIPNDVRQSKLLRALILSGNNMAGPIPTGLQYCKQLQDLFLDNNHFMGDLPAFLSDFPHLKRLFLQNNNFNRVLVTVPPPTIDKCNLSNNRFACPVPQWAHHECYARCF